MQNEKMNKGILKILGKRGRVTIPFEIRKRVGFAYNDILSFTESEDGKAVTVKRETLCNDCSGGAKDEDTDIITFEDFLDKLTPGEQRTALIHLSVKWAERAEEH